MFIQIKLILVITNVKACGSLQEIFKGGSTSLWELLVLILNAILLVDNIKGKISVVKTSGDLRKCSGTIGKYLLTCLSRSKSSEDLGWLIFQKYLAIFRSSSAINLWKGLGHLRKSSEVFRSTLEFSEVLGRSSGVILPPANKN